MIRFLIDADSAIYGMSGGNEVLRERITALAPGEIGISAISFAEIAHGSRIGKPPPPEVLQAFLAAIPLVPFDEAAARAYARLTYRRGFDRLLAAHALSIGATVVTNNVRDFADVPGLIIENWTA